MLDAGRRQQIVAYVEANDGATVAELAEAFSVSSATVRRDLVQLSQQGFIERAHGGAAPKPSGRARGYPEPPILKRSMMQVEEKRAIGMAAAKHVEDGDVILISGGTTTAEMIPYLANREDLTIFTNALNIASLLAVYPGLKTVVVGGILRHSEMSMLGPLTEEALRNIRADKLFMGSPAIHPEYGFSADDMTEVQSDRALMDVAREITVLADYTKFGRIAMMRQALISRVRRLVTDGATPTAIVEAIREQGVEVDVAGAD
jgi:DeoR/GlpR family transcriptional regulator of sugar metabolism